MPLGKRLIEIGVIPVCVNGQHQRLADLLSERKMSDIGVNALIEGGCWRACACHDWRRCDRREECGGRSSRSKDGATPATGHKHEQRAETQDDKHLMQAHRETDISHSFLTFQNTSDCSTSCSTSYSYSIRCASRTI